VKHCVAIRHVAFEGLGIIEPLLKSHGYNVAIIDAAGGLDRATLSAADLLIVLGGPIGAYEEATYAFLRTELEVLEDRLAERAPTLGICLGAQLIARAAGARVYPNHTKEIGWSTLMPTSAGETSPLRHLTNVPVLHWHGDTYDLPSGAELLASTEVCAQQAFSIGPNLLALQFHCETDANAIEHWLIGHAHELAANGIDIAELRAESKRNAARMREAGTAVFSQWLERPTP
jgi:GMP synthase (glutamine-hydrolysing)